MKLTDLPKYIAKKIEVSPDGCWLWTGVVDGWGYSKIGHRGRTRVGHRLVYEVLVGEITEPTLDHLCRVRHCLNPDHLEPVSMWTNTMRGNAITARKARQTHCKRGHPFSDENTYRYRTGRICRACRKDYYRKQRQSKGTA